MKDVWGTNFERKWWRGEGGLKALLSLTGPKMDFDKRGGEAVTPLTPVDWAL